MQEVARANLVRASLILADTSSPISNSIPQSISATNAQSTPISTPRGHGDESNHTHTQTNTQTHTQTYNDHPPLTPQKLQISKYAPQRPDEPTSVPTPVVQLGKGAAHLINGLVGGAGRSISKVGASIIGVEKPGFGSKTDHINNRNGNNGSNDHSQPPSPVMRTTATGNGIGTGQTKMNPNDNNHHNNNSSMNANSTPQSHTSHNMNAPHSVSTNRNITDTHEGSSTVSTGTKGSALPPGVVMRSTASHRPDSSTSAPPSPPKPDSMINKFSSFFGGGK